MYPPLPSPRCRSTLRPPARIIAVLKVGPKFIYNLVTKAKYYGKPTYESLRKTLVAMKIMLLSIKLKI